jgi:hypothetical protein
VFTVLARDAFIVQKLNDVELKLDTLMRIVSKMSADNSAAQPELPSDVSLPIATLQELEAIEKALKDSPSTKDCLVR